MTRDTPKATDATTDPAAITRAALVALWLLNMPLGMWMARGYYLAAGDATATLGGRLMSLWLLALGVGLALSPGLLGALGLAALGWQRTAAAWTVAWCVAAHAVLLGDSVAYHLLRIHLTNPAVIGALTQPGGVEGIGASDATFWLAVATVAAMAALECGALAGLWRLARRTRAFARVRAAVGRVPLAVRLGVVGGLVLPWLGVAAADPREPPRLRLRH